MFRIALCRLKPDLHLDYPVAFCVLPGSCWAVNKWTSCCEWEAAINWTCEWQMPTNASKWPSRWWRWTETRWPGSSGSSSKRRWEGGEKQQRRHESRRRICRRCLNHLFLYHCPTRGWGGGEDYLCKMRGRDVCDVSAAHWLVAPQREQMACWLRDENVERHEIKIASLFMMSCE